MSRARDLANRAASSDVVVGSILHIHATSAPTGYLKANGNAISRTTYAALFAVIGTAYGTGDGSTTFNLPDLPDLRGEFLRGHDDGRGIDASRVLGSLQAEMTGPHNHTASVSSDSAGTPTYASEVASGGIGSGQRFPSGTINSGARNTSSGALLALAAHSHTATVNNNSGTENARATWLCWPASSIEVNHGRLAA